MNGMTANAYEKNDNSGVKICHICYALYAFGLITFYSAIIGVLINYFNRSTATPYCLSHHNWMIKTFWISIIALIIIIIVIFQLISVVKSSDDILAADIILFTISTPFIVWYIYRIVKGWRRLCQRKSIG
jgi:uncharacterized membrane protein